MVSEICQIVREAAAMLTSPEAEKARHAPDTKHARNDFVTDCDRAMQRHLIAALGEAFPNARFLGEEDNTRVEDFAGDVFVIDPIDGTTNFVYDLHHSGISVGLLRDGEPCVGVIYDPYIDALYYAEKGKGAFVNGRRMAVSTAALEDSLVTLGTAPYYKDELGDTVMAAVERVFRHCLDFRRAGAASLDFADIAAGRSGAFFELRLSPWDYAAAATIIPEAGGVICRTAAPCASMHPAPSWRGPPAR